MCLFIYLYIYIECYIQLQGSKQKQEDQCPCPYCYKSPFEVIYTPISSVTQHTTTDNHGIGTSTGSTINNSTPAVTPPPKAAGEVVIPTCSVHDRLQLERDIKNQYTHRNISSDRGARSSGVTPRWGVEHGSRLENMRFEEFLMSQGQVTVDSGTGSGTGVDTGDGHESPISNPSNSPTAPTSSVAERDTQSFIDSGDAATLEDIMLLEAIQLSMQLHSSASGGDSTSGGNSDSETP